MISFDAYLQILEAHGGTDVDYLRRHWPRFCATKRIFEAEWRGSKPRVLDVGAHWLHQALLFAVDGYRVTAADLAATIEAPNVVSLARACGIDLVCVRDLSAPDAFGSLSPGSFDVVILGEVLEHVTFNPVSLWQALYRVLAEGGRIVLTTPNYYALTRRHLHEFRAWRGWGSGITVDEILRTPTYGHHWKEFSRREVVRYFELLSPDFLISRTLYVEDEPVEAVPFARGLAHAIRKSFPPLRERLHVEIDLPKKTHGIVIAPGSVADGH